MTSLVSNGQTGGHAESRATETAVQRQ